MGQIKNEQMTTRGNSQMNKSKWSRYIGKMLSVITHQKNTNLHHNEISSYVG
jgi:hypothetical protein